MYEQAIMDGYSNVYRIGKMSRSVPVMTARGKKRRPKQQMGTGILSGIGSAIESLFGFGMPPAYVGKGRRKRKSKARR